MIPYLSSRQDFADAAALIESFGTLAADEAAIRADHSRTLGNLRHFCRWRQVERLIAVLASGEATGTVH